jgi:hypothetical protein
MEAKSLKPRWLYSYPEYDTYNKSDVFRKFNVLIPYK